MGRVTVYHHSFNTGIQDTTALARVDLERMRLAAEVQTNILPKATGPAFMRPGLEYLSNTQVNDYTRLKEFVFGATDAALMEFGDEVMRIRDDDDVLVTRPAVTASVTSGAFSASTGWTLSAGTGATATISGGYLNLTAEARGSYAEATQTVTVNESGTEHALRIVVERGPVQFRCGSTSGGDEYIAETTLRTGTHSLAFTPTTSNFYIKFRSESRALRRVDSIAVESAGVMSLPTPWPSSALDLMRFAQSADVVFVACRGYQQRRIERRSARSWSVVLYTADDGPFTPTRTRAVRLKPSVTEGNGTLTSDAPFFNSNMVGALFKLTHAGQRQTVKLAADDTFTDPIRVTGVNYPEDNGAPAATDRDWTWTVTGTWAGRLVVHRSFDGEDFGYKKYGDTGSYIYSATANGSKTPKDDDDNAIIYYKFGFAEGDYTSGTAEVEIDYASGAGHGICRVVGYTSATEVDIEVLTPFKGTTYVEDWQEGEWSNNRVWPSAVAFSDGRLFWSGEDRLWGSVSDAFESFDETLEGDAGPISRSIATGGVNDTQWLLSLQRLIIGTEGVVAVAKSSSLDEPLTPTNVSIRDAATFGMAPVDPARIDSRGLVIERAGKAVMEVLFQATTGEYTATQLSKLTTEIFETKVRGLAVQRRPDNRIWMVLEDGGCVCCLYEPDQDVLAFVTIETAGEFEGVAVLPAVSQDRVYFSVKRTIGGTDYRFVEKLALDSEVAPGTLCKVFDAFTSGTNSPASNVISVGTHLAGEQVAVWADGAPMDSTNGSGFSSGPVDIDYYTVDGSGNATLPTSVTNWVAGLPYRARFKSARLAYGAQGGTAMLQKKTVDELGLIMTDFARQGIKVGASFDKMYTLPAKMLGRDVDAIVLSTVHDEVPFSLGGNWGLDSRVCIEVNSPYTATFMGMTVAVTTNG